MNKRQKKKYIHKICIKYQDGCGLMPMLRNPSLKTANVKLLMGKVFNDNIFLQYGGIDFPVDLLYK